MRCIRPLKANYSKDFNSIVYTYSEMTREMPQFEFECRKCLPCRLNIAREKAIRALHESKVSEDNIFLTLTYNEENLESDKLIYSHFQTFIDSLRNKAADRDYISYMVTGEYGEQNKRPHWHAILFNYTPPDSTHKYTSDLGEKVYDSKELSLLWAKGNIEFGSVTLDSASYVARYAAKKLVHGKDQEHDYHPIHKTSKKYAIGKRWIEKNWKHTFQNGFIIINGQKMKIPRYYVDWLKKNKPNEYITYVTQVRPKIMQLAEQKQRKEEMDYISQIFSTNNVHTPRQRSKVKETILKSKFKNLQEKLKL